MTDSSFLIPFEDLPDRFIKSLEHPSHPPVPAKPAATIALLRDSPSRMEILLLRRDRSASFVPGAYVFPGGRVDRADWMKKTLARVDGLTPETAADRLGLADTNPPAIAYYVAALREAFEETGILIGVGPNSEAPPTAAEDANIEVLRNGLMEGHVSFTEALEQLSCRIDGSSIEYLAHWITPEREPRRFDTRFFAARVQADTKPMFDPREMTDAVWVTPQDAISRNQAGTLPMIFPTISTLQQLADYATAEDALREIGNASIPTVLPRLIITEKGVRLNIDEEES
jgi:8-oxo-dGTP pyrophosphatase MutT (NUDIX family)